MMLKMVEASQKLVEFMESIENTANDLAWIRDVSGHEYEIDDYIESDRMKRSSRGINDILENFNFMRFYLEDDFNDELESGDAWYNSFRTEECKYINCKNTKPNIVKNNKPKRLRPWSRPAKNLTMMKNKYSKNLKNENFLKKYNEINIPRSHPYIQNQNIGGSKLYGSHNKTYSYSPAYTNKILNPVSMNNLYGNQINVIPNKNNMNLTNQSYHSIFPSYPAILNHVTQNKDTTSREQSGPVLLKDQLEKTKNDLSHEANYKLSKIEQEAMDNMRTPNISLSENNYKYFQPQQNIGDFESLKMDDQPRTDPKRSLDPALEIKLKVSNRMMSKGLGASLPSDALDDPRRYISVNDVLSNKNHDKDSRENDYSNNHIYKRYLENNNEEDLERNNDVWENTNEAINYGRKLLAITEDVSGLEKQNITNEDKIDNNNQTKYDNKTNANTTSDDSFRKEIKDDDVVIQTSFHTKMNQSLNNTFIAHRKALSSLNDFNNKIIEKRGLIFKYLSPRLKQRTNKDVRSLIETSTDNPDDPVNGKLSSQLVQAIFELVQTNDDFRTQIWPGLKNQKITTIEELQDFGYIRNENNQAEIEHTEEMLRKVMETINNIIEQQVHSRTCLPLRPDLQDFYNQIIESRRNNEKNMINIKNPNNSNNNHESGHIYKRYIPDEAIIRKKCSIVKKLLNQYDYLSFEDQQKAKELKDYLQMHLNYLNEFDALDKNSNEENRQRRERLFDDEENLNRNSTSENLSNNFKNKPNTISEINHRSSLKHNDDINLESF